MRCLWRSGTSWGQAVGGTFAEALLAVLPFGAGPSAAAPDYMGVPRPGRPQVEDEVKAAGSEFAAAAVVHMDKLAPQVGPKRQRHSDAPG